MEFPGYVRLSADLDLGRLRSRCGYGGLFLCRVGSVCTRIPRTVRREVVIEIKSEEVPESRKSCSGAVRGLVNRFPGFSTFQDFILTRPHSSTPWIYLQE